MEHVSGYYPSPSVKMGVVFEGLSGADVQLSQLPKALPRPQFQPIPTSEPFPIICYMRQLTQDCVIAGKAFCSVGTYKEDESGMTAIPVEVHFPAETFVNIGGLDAIGPGSAQYRGVIEISNPDSTLFGTPIDISGLLVPLASEERTA